jgi:hypothetical protein
MRSYVVARTQFEALHRWEGCPYEDVSFLRTPHRHIFHVEVKAEVKGNDREIEFIKMKRQVTRYINQTLTGRDIGNMSCEMIAEDLLHTFPLLCEVSVFEDGENGAVVQR